MVRRVDRKRTSEMVGFGRGVTGVLVVPVIVDKDIGGGVGSRVPGSAVLSGVGRNEGT